MIAPIIMLDTPSSTTAYDTALPANGAPAPVGAVRFHQHATYGYQAYRLVRASGAAITSGLVVALSAASAEIGVDASVAATARPKIAGIAQNAIADGYWGWVLCGGRGTGTAGASGVTAGGSIVNAGTGKLIEEATPGTPTAPEALAVIGKSLTTSIVNATATVFLAGLI